MTPAPLRILQVNSLFTGGGVDNQTLNLSVGLQELGQDVTLAVPAGSRYEPAARAAGLRVETFPARSFLKNALLRRCIQLIRRQRIQILHVHQGRDYWPAIIAARLAGVGTHVVVTRHLMTAPRKMSRHFLLRFATVIAVSRAVENVLRAHLCGPAGGIHQVYCGVDFARFFTARTPAVWQFRERMGWPADAVVCAVIGTFHPPLGKGQREFLEAAARLKDEFPRARFALIGHGSMEALLRERIAALGLGAVAALHPFQEEMPLCMNAIDVLAHPTCKGEAFGLVTVEALAAGRAVVASRKDGLAECFTDGEHGLFVPPGDITALTAALRTFLSDAGLRQRLGAAGSAHVRARFSREELARRTRELYLRLNPRS